MRNSMIYDAQVATPRMPRPQDSLPKQGGLGWVSSWAGVGLLLVGLQLWTPFNPSPQPPVIKQVTPNGEVFLFSKTL